MGEDLALPRFQQREDLDLGPFNRRYSNCPAKQAVGGCGIKASSLTPSRHLHSPVTDFCSVHYAQEALLVSCFSRSDEHASGQTNGIRGADVHIRNLARIRTVLGRIRPFIQPDSA